MTNLTYHAEQDLLRNDTRARYSHGAVACRLVYVSPPTIDLVSFAPLRTTIIGFPNPLPKPLPVSLHPLHPANDEPRTSRTIHAPQLPDAFDSPPAIVDRGWFVWLDRITVCLSIVPPRSANALVDLTGHRLRQCSDVKRLFRLSRALQCGNQRPIHSFS